MKGKKINLREVAGSQDVSKCYRTVEQGAYFTGEAWGIIEDNFSTSKKITLSLEFRTTNQTAVFVSTTNDKNHRFALELYQGRLKLTVPSKDKSQTLYSKKDSPFVFCDNMWHKVAVVISEKIISLSPQGQPEVIVKRETPLPDNTSMGHLTVGGLPADMKQSGTPELQLTGCIRSLSVNGRMIDWYKIGASSNIRKTGCPTS